MPERPAIPDTPAVRELIAEFVARAMQEYRVDAARAEEAIREVMAGDRELLERLTREPRADRIARTRDYKDAAKLARERLYYGLRRYWEETGQEALAALEQVTPVDPPETVRPLLERVLLSHASTRERAGAIVPFYAMILDSLDAAPRSILDVGCGVLPLAFPFETPGSSVQRYVAIDQDAQAISALVAYARWRNDGRLIPLRWRLEEGWDAVERHAGMQPRRHEGETEEASAFDVALLLKMVPVVERQSPELLALLAAAPARQLVVTGSRVAMVKQRSIERRERAVLRKFLEQARVTVASEFETGDEFGFVARR